MRSTRANIKGLVRASRVPQALLNTPAAWRFGAAWRNHTSYEWGAIMTRLMVTPGAPRISGGYLEFMNMDDPEDTFTPPTEDQQSRAITRAYYDDLANDARRDYLRVTVTSYNIGSSDPTLFPLGNQNIFFIRTAGMVGMNGKPFGYAYNSKIIGGALVAMPSVEDATQDLVFAQEYAPPEEQILKPDQGQVGLEWTIVWE